jgi:hypothetical protein
MPRGRPRKIAAPGPVVPVKRGPGRPRKVAPDSGENVFARPAELIGWALGGLEREIAQTRDRLTTLTAQAVQLRDRLARSAGLRLAAGTNRAASGTATSPTTRRRRRRKLTAEQRKAISERMKKRWAERRSKSSK